MNTQVEFRLEVRCTGHVRCQPGGERALELARSIIVREITVDKDVVALDEAAAGEKASGIDFGDRDLNGVRICSDDLGMRFADRPGDRGLACF